VSTGYVVTLRHGFVSQQLPQVRERLNLGQLRPFEVALELHQLQLDLQLVVLAAAADLALMLADVDVLLEAVQVLLGQFQRLLRELRIEKQRSNLKRKASPVSLVAWTRT
jgi:hypothetical protein